MKVHRNGAWVEVTREGKERMKNASQLLHHVKKALIAQGMDVIKKEMCKDGHLTSEGQFYIRSRRTGKGCFAIYDERYRVRDLIKDFHRDGVVYLNYVDL